MNCRTAKIVNRVTGKVIAEIVTNHSMSLDDACDLMGLQFVDEALGIYPDGDLYYEDLDLVYA